MKNKISLLAIALMSVLIALLWSVENNNSKPKVLEVYTLEDIIYIDVNKLQVSFESDTEAVNFKSFKEINDYVSDITAEQTDID